MTFLEVSGQILDLNQIEILWHDLKQFMIENFPMWLK